MGFTPTPGVPVFVVDTNGKAVGGGGVGQDGQAITGNNNGQDAQYVPMQMCTCSAGVTNATYSGPGRVRLRGGNNSGMYSCRLIFIVMLLNTVSCSMLCCSSCMLVQ